MDKDFQIYKNYKEIINALLDNYEDLDVNEDDVNNLVRSLMEADSIVAGIEYNMPEALYFVIGEKVESNTDEIRKTIKKIPASLDGILLVIIVKSISEKIKIEKKIKGLIPKRIKEKIICAQQINKNSHHISIYSRLNSMTFEGNRENTVYPEGQLFIAKLYDLVALYDEMGDLLFENNVRYSISSDKNNVDAAIQDTLEKEPNNFWFYNNGITILADKIECYESNAIQIYSSHENCFSVINGAQTITACANYFFNPNVDEQHLRDAKEAYVLLRVITVHRNEEGTLNEKRKIEKKISVSLNRQKPIDNEDLAFNSNLVQSINNMSNDNVVGFAICRKGDKEITESEHAYLLSEVARYVLASKLQRPGQAKNMYKRSILKMEGDSFKKVEILPDIEGRNFKQKFISQYGLVNLSNKLFQYFTDCKEIVNDLTGDQKNNYGQLFDNGHYYFIAIVIRALFIDSFGDAEDKVNLDRIKLVDKNLDAEKCNRLVLLYKNLILSSLKNKKVDYSEMKKDIIYKDIYESDAYRVFMNEATKLVFLPAGLLELREKGI